MGIRRSQAPTAERRGRASLIERLALPESAVRSGEVLDEFEEVELIARSIWRLINSPRGHALCNPDFGFDFGFDSNNASAEMRRTICMKIRQAVSTFEPRVKVTDVRSVTSGSVGADWSANMHFVLRESGRSYIMGLRQSSPGKFELVEVRRDD